MAASTVIPASPAVQIGLDARTSGWRIVIARSPDEAGPLEVWI
jgi:hypothetical protein